METLFLVLSLTLILGFSAWLIKKSKQNRPENKIIELGVCFTTNTAYTHTDLTQAIQAFLQSWISTFPNHEVKLKKALKQLDIVWHVRRIEFNDDYVLALMERPNKIHLWIGPKLKDGKRSLAYTGLLDQLGKLALLANNLDPDTQRPEIRKILANARTRML